MSTRPQDPADDDLDALDVDDAPDGDRDAPEGVGVVDDPPTEATGAEVTPPIEANAEPPPGRGPG